MIILSYLNTSNLNEATRLLLILPINVAAMIPTRAKITNVGQHRVRNRVRIFSNVVADLLF